MWSLRRWWRNLWRAAPAADPDPPPPRRAGVTGGTVVEADAPQAPPRRHYTAPPVHDDPQREARLGAVLEALRPGPATRAQLGARVGADGWEPGRLDAVVDHGLATGVLLESDGAVRARYAD